MINGSAGRAETRRVRHGRAGHGRQRASLKHQRVVARSMTAVFTTSDISSDRMARPCPPPRRLLQDVRHCLQVREGMPIVAAQPRKDEGCSDLLTARKSLRFSYCPLEVLIRRSSAHLVQDFWAQPIAAASVVSRVPCSHPARRDS